MIEETMAQGGLSLQKTNTYSCSHNPEDGTMCGRNKSMIKGKGKSIPLQTWTGPEDSRRLRLPDLKTIGT